MNRVTDTCIPETVMRHIETRLIAAWQAAAANGDRKTPSEYLFQVLDDPALSDHYQIDPAHSWMLAAKEMGIAKHIPEWVAPQPDVIEAAGNTFLWNSAWWPAIGLLVLGQVIARVDHFGLSYVLFRITSDVERLPFPLAPIRLYPFACRG